MGRCISETVDYADLVLVLKDFLGIWVRYRMNAERGVLSRSMNPTSCLLFVHNLGARVHRTLCRYFMFHLVSRVGDNQLQFIVEIDNI